MSEFFPYFNHDEGAGHSQDEPDEPDESSIEDITDQLEEMDRELMEAGKDVPVKIPDDEIRQRIRDRVNELERDELEISENGHKEIQGFLNILGIRGADSTSEQEIEILWKNLNRHPSLVKDFVWYLADRKTKNFYSEYPLLPDMKDLLEFADGIENADALRPQQIRKAVSNLESFGFHPDKIRAVVMSQNDQLAERVRFLGWLAGMPFMRGAPEEIKEYVEENDIQNLTIENLAHIFIITVSKHLNMLNERSSKESNEYIPRYKMDKEALEFGHTEVLKSMVGIHDLLFQYFLEK
jgi:hypothetical protein